MDVTNVEIERYPGLDCLHLHLKNYSIVIEENEDGEVRMALWEKDFDGCEPLQQIETN